MQDFDINQLRTFVAAIDAGSLTAAAPQVFLSQSAVSEQLRKLEERAGHPLLVRSKSGVVPTPAGERLLAHARRLLALSEAAWRDLHGVALAGTLRLGVTDYFRTAEMAALLARLGAQHPQVRLCVTVRKSDEVEAGHARGEFDLAITMRIVEGGTRRPAGDELRREPLRWAAAPGVRRARGEPLRLVALPDTCSVHRFVVGLLARRKVPYAVVHVASGVAGLHSALAAGLGIGCLNESALPASGAVALPAPHGLPALPQAVFRLLPPRAGEAAFVAQAREVVKAAFA